MWYVFSRYIFVWFEEICCITIWVGLGMHVAHRNLLEKCSRVILQMLQFGPVLVIIACVGKRLTTFQCPSSNPIRFALNQSAEMGNQPYAKKLPSFVYARILKRMKPNSPYHLTRQDAPRNILIPANSVKLSFPSMIFLPNFIQQSQINGKAMPTTKHAKPIQIQDFFGGFNHQTTLNGKKIKTCGFKNSVIPTKKNYITIRNKPRSHDQQQISQAKSRFL